MRKVLKWTGIVLGGLVVLVLLLGGVLYFVGGSKLNRTYDVATADLVIPTDSASIARGAHLIATNGCRLCHGENLGGTVMIDEPPFRIVASNLTAGAGGVGARYAPEDFDRAIRHGLRPDGSFLFIMPSSGLHQLADRDVAAIIAYLQRLPSVDNELPSTEFRALGRIIAATSPEEEIFMEVRTDPAPRDAPEPGPTAAYGAYVASGLCAYCHGVNMEGDETPPGPPGMLPAPSLSGAGRWTLEEFKQALRTGATPGGRTLNSEFMPIDITRHYDDSELEALHAYLRQRFGIGGAQAATVP
jgi:cytochrome c553